MGYEKPRNAVQQHVEREDKRALSNLDEPQNATPLNYLPAETVFINEAGMYSLIFSSKLELAKAFKRRVTHEVLPDIRKHGMYISDKKAEQAKINPEEFNAVVNRYIEEKEKRKAIRASRRFQSKLIKSQ